MFCEKCIFFSYYRDMGSSTPICTRQQNLLDAICAFVKAKNDCLCNFYITKDFVKSFQDLYDLHIKPFIN